MVKPDYYKNKQLSVDVIDICKMYNLNFNLGNVIKYVCRAGKKTEDATADLRKAIEYLEREIEYLNKNNDKNL